MSNCPPQRWAKVVQIFLVQIIWFSCPDFFLENVWSRQNPDLNLDLVWTKFIFIFRNFQIVSRFESGPENNLDSICKILKIKMNFIQTESRLKSGFCLHQASVETETRTGTRIRTRTGAQVSTDRRIDLNF